MKITSLDLSIAAPNGIKPGKMERLGDLVILAGPNGAGKSRILSTLHASLTEEFIGPDQVKNVEQRLAERQVAIARGENSHLSEDYAQKLLRMLAGFYGVKFEGNERQSHNTFWFFPTAAVLADERQMRPQNVEAASRRAKTLGLASLRDETLPLISSVLNERFRVTHPDMKLPSAQQAVAISAAEDLIALIEKLLKTKLELNRNQNPTLFGKPIAETSLSEGQAILLQLAVALYAQEARLDGSILLLDEPECHLHPSVIIEAIEQLRAVNKGGQIWIATHCVPVLAAMPPESIWYVNNSEVKWAGRMPEIVLEGLLGGPQGRERMEDFLRLPAQFASAQFAAECLLEPKAVDTGSDDPQAKQLRLFCQQSVDVAKGSLRVLDFGAGRGRLLSAMVESWMPKDEFSKAIDYKAFELSKENADQLKPVIQKAYPEDKTVRLFKTSAELDTEDEKSLDIVVMCNVLHEVPHEQWHVLFGDEGRITKLLKPNGHLLILEDMEIPKGERAHQFGFFLLGRPQLHKLFCCTASDENKIKTELGSKGRLQAHLVPASLLGRTTPASKIAALKSLKLTANDELSRLTSSPPGQAHEKFKEVQQVGK